MRIRTFLARRRECGLCRQPLSLLYLPVYHDHYPLNRTELQTPANQDYQVFQDHLLAGVHCATTPELPSLVPLHLDLERQNQKRSEDGIRCHLWTHIPPRMERKAREILEIGRIVEVQDESLIRSALLLGGEGRRVEALIGEEDRSPMIGREFMKGARIAIVSAMLLLSHLIFYRKTGPVTDRRV